MNLIFNWSGSLVDPNESSHAKLWTGVREAVICLSQKHKLTIFSTIEQNKLDSTIEFLGMRNCFQKVTGSVVDKSHELQTEIAALSFSLDETVFVGDTVQDIEAAKVCGIAPLAVSYGTDLEAGLAKAEPESLFPNFRALCLHFDKMAMAESRFFPVATVGGIIFDEAENILLVRTRKWSNTFGVPGGKIDYGETMEAAFVREAKEETGLNIFNVIFVMNQEAIEHPQFYRPRHYILVNYRAKAQGVKPKISLNHESDAYRWVTMEEAAKMNLNEPTKILLETVMQKKRSA